MEALKKTGNSLVFDQRGGTPLPPLFGQITNYFPFFFEGFPKEPFIYIYGKIIDTCI